MRSKAELTAAIRRDSRIVLVVNKASRRGRTIARVASSLDAAGIGLLTEPIVTEPDALPEALAQALAIRPDLLILGGGDGSMSTAVNQLDHRDVALGVLPLGTTNNFARSLDLPLGLAAAVRTIGAGKVADIDLGRVHGAADSRVFANLTSLGLSVQVAREVPHRLKRVLGRAAYALTALRALPGHRPFQVTLTTPDAKETLWTHQLNIANGRFHAGRAIADDASIDDRQLVVYRLGDERRHAASLAMVDQFIRGNRQRLAARRYLTANEVRVETDPPLAVDVDGEIWGQTPITITTSPNALRVVVPSTFEDN